MIKISIKKLLIIIMVAIVFISIALFSVVSIRYMDTYFDEYIENIYAANLTNIIEFSKIVIEEGKQPRMILNSYIIEPIYYAEIYDADKDLIMSSGMMGNIFKVDEDTMVIEEHDVIKSNNIIGYVAVVRAKNVSYTNTKQIFANAIYTGAIIAVILVLVIIGILGVFIIKYITNDTKKIVTYAIDEDTQQVSSKIREFSKIIRAIKGYRTKLAIKEKVKKEKFDKVLHETKTPITVLKSQLEGTIDGLINIDKNRASDMVKEVDKLDNILKNFTTIIEGENIEENINIVKIDYSKRIEKIVNSLNTKFNNKNLKLIYDKKAFVIDVDVQILDSVVYNLLINSCKYTKQGDIKISTFDNVLIIKDTGIGIKADEIDKVFDPYFRGSNIGDIDGEGIGLYHVKSNLDTLGIDIEINSKENEFTEFKLIF